MAELTLKDESVIDIGQAVGERVQSIASAGTGNAVVPAGGAAVAPVQPMNPFDSMMVVLEDMLPWEREVYVSLLVNYLKEEKERRERDRRRGAKKK